MDKCFQVIHKMALCTVYRGGNYRLSRGLLPSIEESDYRLSRGSTGVQAMRGAGFQMRNARARFLTIYNDFNVGTGP